ncbi:MAG: hypothetical protein ACTHK7_16000 [Aureliella sp.]
MAEEKAPKRITDIRHPAYTAESFDWSKWRDCYKGGEEFINGYLKQFSKREDKDDFAVRRALTPVPAHAKAAINDIRSSIFQRMSEVTRSGGSLAYQKAVKGEGLGVDNRGNSMTSFIGQHLLEDLLVIGKVGVYVDAPALNTPTLVNQGKFKPYLYAFSPEDILSWKRSNPEDPSAFDSVMLRETCIDYDDTFGLPCGTAERYRYVWLGEDGFVTVMLFDKNGETLNDQPAKLQLKRIPFVLLDIGDSLMRDIANHQIALLNLWSSNIAYGVQGSFPIYTEQRDGRAAGGHLLHAANADGTASSGGQGASDEKIEVGVMKGRYYDLNTERPNFINPSSEPLKANLELCNSLKEEIRELVNLAVTNLATQASAESKQMDNQGLESGLSFIGLVLEAGERQIAQHWAAYENAIEDKQQIATVAYPQRWSLKSNEQKILEANEFHALAKAIPGQTVKKEACKLVVDALFGPKLPQEVIEKIQKEIDAAPYTTSDPEIIQMAKEQGLVGDETGSLALGFGPDEYKQAQKDHTERLARIAEAQTPPGEVPGVRDTSPNASASNRAAKAAQRDTSTQGSTKKPVRGKGKKVQ